MGAKHLTHTSGECRRSMMALQDGLELLKGKWKVFVIGSLCLGGKRRFNEMLREIPGITAKMLSKELKDLEMNKLVKRNVLDSMPVTVEYEMTDYGLTLTNVINAITEWGMEHRRIIMSATNDK